MMRTGRTIAGDPLWTAEEDHALRAAFPERDAIVRELPSRSKGAIMQRARRLGLVKPRRVWSDSEAAALRHPYVTGLPVRQIAALFPDRTHRQIWHKAHAMGYRRPRRPPRSIGIPIIDSIRRRAFDLRLTMTELDHLVGRKQCFSGPRRIDWTAVRCAVTLLGGHLQVSFE